MLARVLLAMTLGAQDTLHYFPCVEGANLEGTRFVLPAAFADECCGAPLGR